MANPDHLFQGNWQGGLYAGSGVAGFVTLYVSGDGAVTGTIDVNRSDRLVYLSGSITESGEFRYAYYHAPRQRSGRATLVWVANGRVTLVRDQYEEGLLAAAAGRQLWRQTEKAVQTPLLPPAQPEQGTTSN